MIPGADAAREQLRERGWAVIRGAVADDELRRLRAAFDRALGSPLPAIAQQPGARRRSAALRAWLLDGRLGALGRTLLGCARVRLLQDALIGKGAGLRGEVAWHRDASYTGYLDPERVVSVRLALGPETLEDGGLEVLDGSHRWPEPVQARHGADRLLDELPGLAPEQRDRVQAVRTEVRLDPGDLSIHGPLTWHRSAPNRGPRVRRTVVAHLFDADARIDLSRVDPGARDHFPLDAAGRLRGPDFPDLR